MSDPGPNRAGRSFRLTGAAGRSWLLMKQNYWFLVAVSTVYVAAMGGLTWILDALGSGEVLGIAVGVLIMTPLWSGVVLTGARLARNERADWRDVMAGFARLGPVITVAVVFALLHALLQIAANVSDFGIEAAMSGRLASGPGDAAAGAAGTLMFLIAVLARVVAEIRLWPATVVCIDPRFDEVRPVEAVISAWVYTRGQFWRLLGAGVTIGLVVFGSVLLAGIGVILLGMPLAICAWGVVYARLIDAQDRAVCPACGAGLRTPGGDRCPACGTDQSDGGRPALT